MRNLILILATALFAPVWAGEPVATGKPMEMTVYKSPTCGCCADWVQYLEERDFEITVIDQPQMHAVKAEFGVPPQLQSCHTGVIDGYVIEGHVPAEDILRLLAERPAVTGLTAPGMPPYSPGMMSIEPRGYDVLSFTREGKTKVYSSY
jgi:hypothetical protein